MGEGGRAGGGAGAGAGAADPMLGPGAPGYVDPASAAAAPPPPLPPPSDLAEGNLRLELTSKIIGGVTSGRGGGIDRVYHVSTLAGDDVAFELFPGGRYRMRFTNGAAHQAVLTVGLRVVRHRDPMAGRHRLLGRGEGLPPDGSEGEGADGGESGSGQPAHDDLTWSGNSGAGGGVGMGSAQGALPSGLDLDANPGQELAALMEQMEGTARAAGKVLQGVRNEALRMTTRQATNTKVVKDHLWSLDTSMACYVAVAVVLAGLQVLLVRALAEEVRGDGALIPFHRQGKGGGVGGGEGAGGTSMRQGVGVWGAVCGSVVGGAVGWVLHALQWLVRQGAGLLDLVSSCVAACLGYCSRSGRGAHGSVRGAKGHARGGRRAPVPSRGTAPAGAGGAPRRGSGADGRSQYAAMMNARMAHRTAANGRTPPP